MPVLTLVDSRRVQEFIFVSNRLADIADGSKLIEQFFDRGRIADLLGGHGGSVVMVGGGNLWARFEDLPSARNFVSALSHDALKKLPGLTFSAVHKLYESGQLQKAIQEAQQQLATAKLADPIPAPLLGLGVTARCRDTGLPASHLDEGKARSRDLYLREQAAGPEPAPPLSTRQQFEARIGSSWKPQYTKSFDRLGRTRGETSQIAIVYLDGNGIGARLGDWLKQESAGDEQTVTKLREISESLHRKLENVLEAVLGRVAVNVALNDDRRPELRSTAGRYFPLVLEKDCCILPVRQVFMGGDDLIFVCDGRLGLELAAVALRAFSAQPLPQLGPVTASAGVSIVGSHFPFIRASQIAHAECARAKRAHLGAVASDDRICWQLGETRVAEQRSCRPYPLQAGQGQLDWSWFAGTLLGTSDTGLNGAVWTQARNKAKALAVLADDPDELQRELSTWRVANPKLLFPAPLTDHGEGPRGGFPLLDALEILDAATTVGHRPFMCLTRSQIPRRRRRFGTASVLTPPPASLRRT